MHDQFSPMSDKFKLNVSTASVYDAHSIDNPRMANFQYLAEEFFTSNNTFSHLVVQLETISAVIQGLKPAEALPDSGKAPVAIQDCLVLALDEYRRLLQRTTYIIEDLNNLFPQPKGAMTGKSER